MTKTISPIRDEASHQAALAEIERLLGVDMDTQDGDRLEILMNLVDAYQHRLRPDKGFDPIAWIMDRRSARLKE